MLHISRIRVNFNFCTCFGQLCVHNQENLLYLCDTGIFQSSAADQIVTHSVRLVGFIWGEGGAAWKNKTVACCTDGSFKIVS